MKKTDTEVQKYEMKISATVNGIEQNARERFKALAHVSDQLADLSKLYEEEAKKIEYEAEIADKPLYQMRSLVIQGKELSTDSGVTIDEFNKRLEELKNDKYDKIEIDSDKNVMTATDDPGIPGFWLHAIKNDTMTGVMIEKKDEELLSKLYDIEHIKQESSNDFVLKFHFYPNEYMQNTVITKRYIMEDDDKVKNVDCSQVKWKQGKNLLEKPKSKKKKKKKAQDTHEESFFHFFTTKEAVVGDPEQDDLESDDEVRLDKLEEDYDIAVEIRDEIIPNALDYIISPMVGDDENIDEAEGEGDAAVPEGETIQDGKAVDQNNDSDAGSQDD